MSEKLVLHHRDGPVAEIVLNRPDVLNAMSRALVDDLCAAFSELSRDDSVRAIVLTGAGRAFCCGLDLAEMSEPGALSGFEWHGPNSLFSITRDCPHPIITAINGFAVTGGLELALLGDFLIASDTAKFADTHARIGITPSWGMTQVLPRLIGVNRARQMSLTGEFIDAKTALAWGLVNEVVPAGQLIGRAHELAGLIAETDRSTMIRIRDLINQSGELGFVDGMALEAKVFDKHIAQVSASDVARNRVKVTERGRRVARKDSQQ